MICPSSNAGTLAEAENLREPREVRDGKASGSKRRERELGWEGGWRLVEREGEGGCRNIKMVILGIYLHIF